MGDLLLWDNRCLFAARVIVRYGSLMPVKAPPLVPALPLIVDGGQVSGWGDGCNLVRHEGLVARLKVFDGERWLAMGGVMDA